MMSLHEKIIETTKDLLGSGLATARTVPREDGVLRKASSVTVYLTVKRSVFHRAVRHLNSIARLHIACPMASREYHDGLDLVYPFIMRDEGGTFPEITVVVSVFLPMEDLSIRTVTDIVPGILMMERETMEMLGVTVEDIPDERRLFTCGTLEEGYYPLRGEAEKEGDE